MLYCYSIICGGSIDSYAPLFLSERVKIKYLNLVKAIITNSKKIRQNFCRINLIYWYSVKIREDVLILDLRKPHQGFLTLQ